MRKTIWWVGGGLVVIAAVVLFFSWRANQKSAPPAAVASSPEGQVAQPAIQNPIPADSGPAVQPLPELEASDAPLQSSLAELIGKHSADTLFKPEQLVRHLVVTVDNLSRKRVAVELRPNKPLPGSFMASGDEQHSTLNPANYQRYAPVIQVVMLADSSVNIGVKPWVNVPDYAAAAGEINKAIVETFRGREIVIPFPQREVRLLGGAA